MEFSTGVDCLEKKRSDRTLLPVTSGRHFWSKNLFVMRGRNYVFTVNNPDGALYPDLCPVWAQHVSYATWQLEVGEEGTLHFQGYLECVGKKSMIQLHMCDGLEEAHFEIRRGTQQQAIDYANKEDTRVEGPWSFGEPKEQGRRSDLHEIKAKCDQGMPIKSIWEEHYNSMIRYHRSVKEYKRIITPPRDWLPTIIVIIGASGVGKSRLAREMFPNAYWKPNNKWWDDYDGQKTVVWDEFKGHYPFQDLLRVLDSTPLTLETKGSSCQYGADTICFTSNFHPSEWYNEESIRFTWETSPLNRRIREFGHIIDLGGWPAPEAVPPAAMFLFNGIPMAIADHFRIE